jgi:AraC-like DNA-binding protein/quercetin dioxygenase-like cupin family protein
MPSSKAPQHRIALPKHGIAVESHHHGPGFQVERHVHSCHSLLHVVSGQGKYSAGRASHDLAAGHTVLIRPGRVHDLIDTPGKPMVVFVVYFSPRIARRNRKLFEPMTRLTTPRWMSPPRARRIRQALRCMLHEQERRAVKYEAVIRESLCSILVEFHRAIVEKSEKRAPTRSASERTRQRVRSVADHLSEHFFEAWDVVEAARMAGLAQRRFRSVFRDVTGNGFSQHLTQLRIERAKHLLRQTDMSVSAIAFEVGYEELSTFYRAFRRTVGSSPLAHRRG